MPLNLSNQVLLLKKVTEIKVFKFLVLKNVLANTKKLIKIKVLLNVSQQQFYNCPGQNIKKYPWCATR